MTIFTLIISLFLLNYKQRYYRPHTHNNTSKWSSLKTNFMDDDPLDKINYNAGYCEIKFNKLQDSNETLEAIVGYFHKKKLLELLVSTTVGIIDKKNVITQFPDLWEDSFSPNIQSGGLMNDWNMNIASHMNY